MSSLKRLIVENNISVLFSPSMDLENQVVNGDSDVMDLVESGDLNLVNSIATTMTTSHKDLLNTFLDIGCLPQPLTYHPRGSSVFGSWERGEVGKERAWELFQEYFKNSSHSPLLVKKKIYEHMGRGVTVHEATAENFYSSSDGLVQPFLYPPFSDGFMRDVRVIVLEGDASNAYTRRAMEPLMKRNSNKPMERIPSKERYMTNIAQRGVIESAPEDYKNVCSKLALKVVETIKRGAGNLSDVFYEKNQLPFKESEISFDWGSVDFIFDENGNPKICEVDSSPNIISYMKMNPSFCSSVAKYLTQKSEGKAIGVLGVNPINDMVLDYLQKGNVDTYHLVLSASRK